MIKKNKLFGMFKKVKFDFIGDINKSKKELYRWKILDENEKSWGILSGPGFESKEECLRHLQKIQNADFTFRP